MKHRFLISTAAVLSGIVAMGQTYGTPFFTEGFDSGEAFAKWTAESLNATDPDGATGWELCPDTGFDAIDPGSKSSAGFHLLKSKRDEQALASPMIDGTGKGVPVIGYNAYVYDLTFNSNNFGAALGLFMFADARLEGEENWEEVFTANTFNGKFVPIGPKGWYNFYGVLPEKYAGKKFQVRLRYRVNFFTNAEDRYVYVDNLYVAEKPAAEAEATKLAPVGVTDTRERETAVSLTVRNNGAAALSNFNIWYQLNDGERVTQTVAGPLEAGATATYDFDEKVDFSTPLGHWDIKAGVMAAGDPWPANDNVSGTIENKLASLPYEPTFVNAATGKSFNEYWENPSVRYGRWVVDADATGHGFWYANMSSQSAQIGNLISRPIIFADGKPVNLRFSANTGWRAQKEDEELVIIPGKIQVYYTPDKSAAESEWMLIYDNQALTNTPVTGNVTFIPTASGPGFIVFKACSDANGKNTQAYVRLENLYIAEAHDYDLAVNAIVAPTDGKEAYGKEETVTVRVVNNGSKEASGAKLKLSVDGNEVALEELPAVASTASVEYTFTKKANLLGPEHKVEVSVVWEADQDAANNAKSLNVINTSWSDLELVSIDGPRGGELTDSEHVVVTIVNKGNTELKDIPLTLKVAMEPDGNPVVIEETAAGPIAPEATLQYTFAAASDFAVDGTYAVEVSSALADDWNMTNNTVATKINSTHKKLDAGVDAIVGPTGKLMGTAENIIISVKNYGEADLFDVPVSATVKRGDLTVADLTGSVASIPVGKSVEYTFAAPVDLSAGGTYTVEAKTSLTKDADSGNDSASGELYAWILDCGVESVVFPTADVEEGEQPITILIRNYGDAPVSDIPVYFKLGNNPQRGTFAGTIQAGETAEYTFPTKYKFVLGRSYKLTAYTKLEGDMDSSNDQCEVTVNPVSGVGSVYVDGFCTVSGVQGGILFETSGAAEAVVYDAAGTCVIRMSLDSNKKTVSLAPGIYVVGVCDGVDSVIKKVAVK
ncbi:MAG: hypothetical protein J6L73_06890 [Muribaculaceae bacterium]|nr:hypothetical protein [Muribaculaceae bacterium]